MRFAFGDDAERKMWVSEHLQGELLYLLEYRQRTDHPRMLGCGRKKKKKALAAVVFQIAYSEDNHSLPIIMHILIDCGVTLQGRGIGQWC